MIDPNQIISLARATLGTAYQHQGRILGVGFDCIGVAIYIADQLGLSYVDMPAYGATPHKGLLQRMVEAQPCLERINASEPGCLFVMEFMKGHPQHIAIFTGDTVIHCASNTGRVVEHRLDADTQRQIVATYRFKA